MKKKMKFILASLAVVLFLAVACEPKKPEATSNDTDTTAVDTTVVQPDTVSADTSSSK
ncbi:MAG: hypothetical protein ACOYXT_04570 [Bacteroidota bacterium]